MLDIPMIQWPMGHPFTIRDACEGVLIMGGLGSGKTSGSGALLAKKYLENGFGGLILTAKEDELQLWKTYCKDFGREDDLIVIGQDSPECFNFLDYESSRSDKGTGITHNIADTLKTVIKAGADDGRESDKAFWDASLQQLLVNAVDLCLLVQKKIRFEHIYQIIQSAPKSKSELANETWRKNSACFQSMEHAATQLNKAPQSKERDNMARRLYIIEDFFLGNWLYLSEKTRSIVEQMFFGFGDRFMRDPLYSLFNTDTTVTPEDTIKGKIIVFNLPYLIYENIGRDGQILFKYVWQRAMQRRQIREGSRPVFLWVDEAHYFLHDHDIDHQSTARSYRACTVYLTQNLPNYSLHAGGGERGMYHFKALAGNLGTKFFHANSDVETNEYAANLVGKELKWVGSEGQSMGENSSFSEGSSQNMLYTIEPSDFARQRTGGPLNEFCVETIVHRQGIPFESTGKNHALFTINQKQI
ncbi:TraM recognition domain-containing protein [Winogradskyella sp. SYSU M77433]|uniref:type IV secretory system conjugative DNA transfer family protein n=1 Tax=Winogradskyella sp. SYSU M77433 TaxID=3042722 RepID=UPI002480A92A|nr:TraM recognition domain-containing protein [Winogradskyella sp. SYSU M77433]MDH7911346.1 TraM recognition domain-containing protein [Winogradskyella sp. SYSU M77433]